MDLKCGFFNSVNGDRTYTADDMSYPYSRIVSNGIVADNTDSSGFQVISNTGLTITVKAGFGLFGGKWAELEKGATLSLSQPHVTLNRIDSIIVRCNKTNSRNVELIILTGTPAENPVVPAITRNDNVIDYRLANILVKASSENINQSDVTDTRATSECGFVTNLLQNSNISSTYEGWRTQFTDWLNAQDEECEQFITEKENDIKQTKEDFESWANEKETSYNQWFSALTQDLTVGNVGFLTYDSVHTAENNGETEIPVGINEFSSNNDVLNVFINGLKLIPEIDYTLNGFESITLTKAVDHGTVISFFLLKTVLISEYETTFSEIQNLQQRCNEIEESISTGGGGGVATNSVNYTYVVDSNQALAEWANNDRSKGQDYTSVLIRKGSWDAPKGINLTNSETKVVRGECGSIIRFCNAEGRYIYGLYYDSIPSTSEYKISDVNIELSDTDDFFDGWIYGFYRCVNLVGCSVRIKILHNVSQFSMGYNFCKNIVNCYSCISDEGDGENNKCFGYYSCDNIVNSSSLNETKNDYSSAEGFAGFGNCTNVTNCRGESIGGSNSTGFQSCTNISQSVGIGILSQNAEFETSHGFYMCKALTLCKGVGTAVGAESKGYGFYRCNTVSKCKAESKCTTSVFNMSYASNASTADYACADTPAGGFNDTTNPSA